MFLEAEANKAAGKYDNASIDFQIDFYKEEGLTPYSSAKLPITSGTRLSFPFFLVILISLRFKTRYSNFINTVECCLQMFPRDVLLLESIFQSPISLPVYGLTKWTALLQGTR